MPTVWLIRHGESKANRIFSAPVPSAVPFTDIPLTSRGYEQAELLTAAFPKAPKLLVTSPYLRARQTTQVIHERFPSVPVEEWQVQEYTYLARVRWTSATDEQRQDARNAYWEECDPSLCDGEGAETFQEFTERVSSVIHKLRSLDGLIAVVTHDFFIRAVYWSLLAGTPAISKDHMRQFYAMRDWFLVPNASISKVVLNRLGKVWLSPTRVHHLPTALITPDHN